MYFWFLSTITEPLRWAELHFPSFKGMTSDLWMTSLHEWMWNQKRCIKVSLWLIPFSSQSGLPVISFQTVSASREDRPQQCWRKVQSASTVNLHPASAVSLVSSRTNKLRHKLQQNIVLVRISQRCSNNKTKKVSVIQLHLLPVLGLACAAVLSCGSYWHCKETCVTTAQWDLFQTTDHWVFSCTFGNTSIPVYLLYERHQMGSNPSFSCETRETLSFLIFYCGLMWWQYY